MSDLFGRLPLEGPGSMQLTAKIQQNSLGCHAVALRAARFWFSFGARRFSPQAWPPPALRYQRAAAARLFGHRGENWSWSIDGALCASVPDKKDTHRGPGPPMSTPFWLAFKDGNQKEAKTLRRRLTIVGTDSCLRNTLMER